MGRLPILALGLLTGACAADGSYVAATATAGVRIAHLTDGAGAGLATLRTAFAARNPGYDLDHAPSLSEMSAGTATRVLFVQDGAGHARVSGTATAESPIGVGDVVLLRAGAGFSVVPPIGAVTFTVPHALPADLPTFIRPDWDPRITDTPGGCATETGAYRRILLTWLGKNGPYLWHALNAHRVRITDSFTHYHPRDGGFDEFYLVQAVQPGARIVTSEHLDRVLDPESVTREEARGLLVSRELAAGDLVYLPRGVVHRGLAGVLAQVITVPGFVPGAEIGVDDQIQRINERHGLTGGDALPVHRAPATPAASRPRP